MTAPYGGTGSSNLGTAYGRVRIDYESAGAAKATKDVEALQNTLVNTGTIADKSARQFEKAQAQVVKSAQRADQILKKGVTVGAPVTISPREVRLDTAAITKAIENFKDVRKEALKVTVPIHISPSKVEVDRGSVTRTLDNFSRAYGSTRIGIKAAVDIQASDISLKRSAVENAVRATQFDRMVVRAPIHIEPLEVSVNQTAIRDRVGSIGPISVPHQVSGTQSGGSGLGAGVLGGALGRGGAAGLGRLAAMGPAVAGIGAIGAAAAVAAPAVGALALTLTKGFGRLQGLDQAAIKLKALGHNTKEIAAISDSALASVERTAFGLDEAFNVAANALAVGIKPGQDLDKYLTAVAGTAALANTSMEDMGAAFNYAAVQGRLTGDIMQLLYARQVPVLQLLAEEYGVTQAKAQQMVSNAEVDFDRFINAMNRNKEAAKAMGDTVSGSFTNLMASVSRIGAMLLAPLFGEATGEASNMAKMIQHITDRLREFEDTLRENRSTIIDFWALMGQGAIIAGHAITAVISGLSGLFGVVMKSVSWLTRAFGEVRGALGDDETKRTAIEIADNLSEIGNSSFEATGKIWGFHDTLSEASKSLDEWREKEKQTKESTDDMAESFGEAEKQAVPLEQALENLQVKSDTVTKAVKGTNEEFRELLKTLKEKGAGDDILKTLLEIRRQYETAGRPVDNFAKAIDRMADSTVAADQKARDFIDTLRELDQLPSGNALADFNDMWREMFAFDADHVDPLSALGDSLLNSDKTINSMEKNGSTLLRLMNELISASTTLVMSGEASPEEAYQRTTQGLQELLRQFGITDPNTVSDIISKYFPENIFVEAIKKGGDPKGAIESVFKGNPAQIESMLNVLTTTQDILGQVLGPGGVLRVPTVIDVQGGMPPPPPGLGAPNDQIPPEGVVVPGGPVKPGYEMRKFPDGSIRAVPVGSGAPEPKGDKGFTPQSVSEAIKRLDEKQRQQKEKEEAEKPWYRNFLPGVFDPDPADMSGRLYKWPGDKAYKQEPLSDTEVEALKNNELVEEIFRQDERLRMFLDQRYHEYKEKGKTLAEAYADGVLSGEEYLREAIKRLAQIAGDGLGASPAKYGPLSGRGWVYFRGQTFTQAWADGIVSQANSVRGASSSVAAASVETFDEKWTRRISDVQAFSDLGKMILDLGNQLSDLAFNALSFLNEQTFGALFPKQYVRDPNARNRSGEQFFGGSWSPQGWEPPKTIVPQGTSLNITAQPSRLKDTGSVPSGPLSRQAAAIVEQFWGDQIRGTIGGSRDHNTAKGTHDKGLSIDIPIAPDQMALGDEIVKYFLDNAEALGVKYTIWRDQGRYPSDPTKVAFTSPGHFNHIDIHFKEVPDMAQLSAPTISFNTPQSSSGQRSSAPTKLNSQQDIANYIISKAMSEGYTRKQAEQFVIQAYGESHLSPTAYNPAGWSGIFQFDQPTWQQAGGGNVMDAKQNIDNYFRLARQRGLTPQSFTDPKQLGTQVSIGGPLHPENAAKGHLQSAISGAAPFIANAAPQTVPGATPQNPLNVALPQQDSKALIETGWNTQSLQTVPQALQDLAAREPLLQQALSKSITNEADAIASLQRIDSLIEEQNRANTPQSKRLAEDLGKIHSNLQSAWGLQQQPSMLEQAQTVVSGISSIASEAFALFDQALTSVAATQEITGTLVRGIANTEDVYNLVDSFQEFITLAQRGFQLASNITGFASQLAGMGAGADPSGGAGGAAGGLAAASAVTGLIAQALGAINTAIDIGQEVYNISTKYLGRFLTSWFGLSGANDVRYLLDEMTGQLHVYTSENPDLKNTFNTLGRALGASYPERQAPTNYLTIYQGPGQDPRDTMDDAMFSIRASGIGAFGYAD